MAGDLLGVRDVGAPYTGSRGLGARGGLNGDRDVAFMLVLCRVDVTRMPVLGVHLDEDFGPRFTSLVVMLRVDIPGYWVSICMCAIAFSFMSRCCRSGVRRL